MERNFLTRKFNRIKAFVDEKVTQFSQDRARKAYWSDSEQRHHDYFVSLYRTNEGNLDTKDMEQYLRAVEKEQEGKVNPLPEDATSPLG